MKLSQKIYPLAGIMLLLSGGVFLSVDSQSVRLKREETERIRANIAKAIAIESIKRAYKEVFGQENLFARENKDTDRWNKMLDGLQSYAHKNAGEKFSFSALSLSKDVSKELINVFKSAYNSLLNKRLSDYAVSVRRSVRKKIQQLKRRKTDLESMSDLLIGTRYSRVKDEMVKEVLLRLMQTLRVTINKLGKDFKKLDRAW